MFFSSPPVGDRSDTAHDRHGCHSTDRNGILLNYSRHLSFIRRYKHCSEFFRFRLKMHRRFIFHLFLNWTSSSVNERKHFMSRWIIRIMCKTGFNRCVVGSTFHHAMEKTLIHSFYLRVSCLENLSEDFGKRFLITWMSLKWRNDETLLEPRTSHLNDPQKPKVFSGLVLYFVIVKLLLFLLLHPQQHATLSDAKNRFHESVIA